MKEDAYAGTCLGATFLAIARPVQTTTSNIMVGNVQGQGKQ